MAKVILNELDVLGPVQAVPSGLDIAKLCDAKVGKETTDSGFGGRIVGFLEGQLEGDSRTPKSITIARLLYKVNWILILILVLAITQEMIPFTIFFMIIPTLATWRSLRNIEKASLGGTKRGLVFWSLAAFPFGICIVMWVLATPEGRGYFSRFE